MTVCTFTLQEFKGYVFKISGGQDKQGFPMKQGVLTNGRVFLLMKPGACQACMTPCNAAGRLLPSWG